MNIRSNHIGTIGIPIIIGATTGAFIVYAAGHLPYKWLTALFLFIMGLSSLIAIQTITQKIQQILLLGSIAAYPIYYDISFLFKDNAPHFVFANGFTFTLSDVLIAPLVVRWLIRLVMSKKFGHQVEHLSIHARTATLLLIFITLNALSTLVSVEPFMTVSAIFWYIKLFVIYLLFYPSAINSKEYFRHIAYALSVILIIEGVIAIEQKFIGKIFTAEFLGRDIGIQSRLGTDELLVRPGGTTGHPNALAMLLNMLIPTVFYFFLTEKIPGKKLLLGASLFLGIIALLLTGSRGGWISIAASMLVANTLWHYKRGSSILGTLAKSALVAAAALTLLFITSTTFRDRLLKDDHGTAEERIPLAQISLNMIQDNPLTGVGTNNYTYVMQRYDNTRQFITKYYDYPVHNTFLLLAAEAGIPSLVLWVIIVSIFIRTAIKLFFTLEGDLSIAALGASTSIIGWCIHNIVDLSPIYMNQPLWLMFGVVTSLSAFMHYNSPTRK